MSAPSVSTSSSSVFQRQAEATESVWLAIGRAAETMGDLERAQKAYERVLNMNPSSWRALTQAAHVCRCREDYPRAVEYFKAAIQIDDKNGDIWSSLGHCYLMQDELQSAYTAYQNALFHLPSPKEDAKLWYGIGILYDRYGSLQHAEEAFSSVLKMDKNFEKADEIYFRLGIIYKQLQRYQDSLQCFDQILRNPPHPLSQMDIWFQIGHVYEQQKDYVKAREAWDRVLAEAPNHAKVLQQLGWLYHQSAAPFVNQETAVQYLTRSLETDSSDAQSWYLLGRAYMTSQKYNKAYEAYQQAVYRDGRNPTFWISIGVLYFQINQFKDALDAYSRAIRLNPYISEVWFDLGSLYESCNQQIKDAMDAYVRAKELDPSNAVVKERLDILTKYLHDPTIPLGPAPPPKDVHPTAYSNFQSQAPDAPPPMMVQPPANRQSPPRHGFNGVGGPLPNGAYPPAGQRSHSRHASPNALRYGSSLPSHGRAGEPEYRGRPPPPPPGASQDVEMADVRGERDRAYGSSRPPSRGGGYPGYHPSSLPIGNNVPPLQHPQPHGQGPTLGGYRSNKPTSRRKSPSQRSPSPVNHLPRMRGSSPPPGGPPTLPGPGGPGGPPTGSIHPPSSSAAGGHYGSYGPNAAARYGAGGNVSSMEAGRSPVMGASSASGGAYGAIVPGRGPADNEMNWERGDRIDRGDRGERRAHGGRGHSHDRERDRDPRDLRDYRDIREPREVRDARDLRDMRGGDYDRDRMPPGPPGPPPPVLIKEEPGVTRDVTRDKGVRLPPPPHTGGGASASVNQQFDNHPPGRRNTHDRRPSDEYEMKTPASAHPSANAGNSGSNVHATHGLHSSHSSHSGHGAHAHPGANSSANKAAPGHGHSHGHGHGHGHGPYATPTPTGYDYDRDRSRSVRGRSPPAPHHPPPPPGPPRSDRRYPEEEPGPLPPRQSSPFHPGPLRPNEASPVNYYDERGRGGPGPDDHPAHYAGQHDARRRPGRGDKDDSESISGTERAVSSRKPRSARKKEKDAAGYPPYGAPQPGSGFPPPAVPRSPSWQPGSYQGQGDPYGRSRANSGSYPPGHGPAAPQHQRYPSENGHDLRRGPPSNNSAPPPPLIPNKATGGNRTLDEDYDEASTNAATSAADALMGLASAVTRTPSSVASTVSASNASTVMGGGGPPSSIVTPSTRRLSGSASGSGGGSPPDMMRPSSQTASRKRRRSGSVSSGDRSPSRQPLSFNNGNSEPDKKKARLGGDRDVDMRDHTITPPPLNLDRRGSLGGPAENGLSNGRPALPRIQTREEQQQQEENRDGERGATKERDLKSPSGPPSGSNALGSLLNGDSNASSPPHPPLRRSSTHQSMTMDSNTNSPPGSAASQETMRNRTLSPKPTSTRSSNADSKMPPLVSHSRSPSEKIPSSGGGTHSRSNSVSVQKGRAPSASPVPQQQAA